MNKLHITYSTFKFAVDIKIQIELFKHDMNGGIIHCCSFLYSKDILAILDKRSKMVGLEDVKKD